MRKWIHRLAARVAEKTNETAFDRRQHTQAINVLTRRVDANLTRTLPRPHPSDTRYYPMSREEERTLWLLRRQRGHALVRRREVFYDREPTVWGEGPS